jgi:signal transduction histidine kinase
MGAVMTSSQHSDLQKQVEVLLKEKQQAEIFSKRKSEFLANMSHELRTPMHAILSFSKMSLKKLGVIEKNRLMNNLEIIYENGQRLLHTLNDILDISKLEAGQMDVDLAEHDIHAEIVAVVRELQSLLLDKGISYNIYPNCSNCIAEFDSYRIGQVLQNILGNAIKFTPTEGKIDITISEVDEDLKISICDQGQGIPPDELEAIFDKYVQSSKPHSKIGGTGLGLSIAKKIIELHNGKIWAENNLIQGSTFHFTIPKKHKE